MLTVVYYLGSTNRISGFAYNTDKKTFKEFVITAKEWLNNRSNFKLPSDEPNGIDYFMPTLSDVDGRRMRLERLGFTRDDNMVLDFGIFTR